ncbi:MAG: hypothetical protein E7521_08825 [Ruminococcaceae bacterium]|nr:hypothetical protein [Oscillospiraceae bacterium]
MTKCFNKVLAFFIAFALVAISLSGGISFITNATDTSTSQQPDWKSHPEDFKLLAFTFDDGPSSNMPRYVDLFSKYEGAGTFFVRGISIKNDDSYSMMQSAIDAGWDIGNHGDNHLVATIGGVGGGEATYDQINADIVNLNTKLESNLKDRNGLPYKVKFYRPPNIKPTENTFKVCTEQDLAVIWLKYDALDWASNKTYNDRYNVFKNGIGTWKDGDVILCHETGVVGAEDTYKILEELLPEFYEAGYRFCSINEYIQMRGISQYQLSGKLPIKNGNRNMVTNIIEVAREKASCGDTNADYVINNKDAALLMQYINGWNVNIETESSDINVDSKINNKDYVMIMRYINNWDITLGPAS